MNPLLKPCLLILLPLLLLVACINPQSDGEDKELTLLYWQAPSLPFPYLAAGYKDRDAGAITLEPLAKFDPEGQLVPALAEAIPTVENGGVSPDFMSITWRLHDDLKWSDGSPLTTRDVAFTWQYCAHPETGCLNSGAFADIAAVEVVDELTVQIIFTEPKAFPYTAFVGAGSPVISQAQFADCVGPAANDCTEQSSNPLGSGPYRIVQFRPSEQAAYERNPHYRGETPYFDRVILKGGGDAATAARAVLVTGDADFAWNLQLEPQQLADMEASGMGTVASAFASTVERILVNQTNPDPALGANRSEYLDGDNPHPFLTFTPIPQAMSLAIDRVALSEQLYGFAGRPTCNLIAGPPRYVSTANDECLTQNLAAANQLLDDNGVDDTDGDGIREYNGIPLRVTYQTTANAVREETQSLIQDWWRQIGIETELVQHDASVFFGGDPVADGGATYRRFFADVQMYATGPGIEPQSHLRGQLCTEIMTPENNWATENNVRACNPQYDQLFAQLAQTTDNAQRETLVKRLNDILVQNYYQIPLVSRGVVSAHSKTLLGVRLNDWDSELWNIAQWRR
ncbi:MAG: peptide ABC transporter substrate-binding protein [Chloroflexi bacterium]|nr:peptide ABC transporter substrate-binding protein [Chloroflexota bacterium]